MKHVVRVWVALLCVVALVAVMAGAAFASGAEADAWLEINNPGVTCLYDYAYVDSTASVPPGSVETWSQAAVVFRVQDPCNFALYSGQTLSAGALGVEGYLICKWKDNEGDTNTQTVWDSGVVYNAANTGLVSVVNGSQTNPCHPSDLVAGTLQERTVVHGYVWTGISYAEYDQTTHWETR